MIGGKPRRVSAAIAGNVLIAILTASWALAGATTSGAVAPGYTGPSTIAPGSWLTAAEPTGDRRVVAVTFRVDGRPLASDAVWPYRVRLVEGDLDVGRHRVVVETVYRTGETRRSSPTSVQVTSASKALVVAPGGGLQALAHRLARGHVTLKLLPGRYDVHELRLGPGVTLTGSGPATVLQAPSHEYWSALLATGAGVTIANLTIDGGGPGPGVGNAVAAQPSAREVMIRDVRIRRLRGTGVYVWGKAHEITVQNCVIDGALTAYAGVVARLEEANDVSVIRSRITRMREFGILFSQLGHDNRTTGLRSLALDNVISDVDHAVDTQGRSKGGIWSGGADASLIGNRITRTGWDGIETVGSSSNVSIARNAISRTKVGIYLEHATNDSTISDNVVARVDTGINVEWRYGGIGSAKNRFLRNAVSHARVGLFVDYGSDNNLLSGNRFSYGERPSIILQGASGNLVTGNIACGADGPVVREQAADPGGGVSGAPVSNVIRGNANRAQCRR